MVISILTDRPIAKWFVRSVGALLCVTALPLLIGGGQLLLLGGSTYYLLAGLSLAVSGVLVTRLKAFGIWFYGALYGATLLWSFYEAGLDFWPLVARLVAPTVLGILVLAAAPACRSGDRRSASPRVAVAASVILISGLAATAIYAMIPRPIVSAPPDARDLPTSPGHADQFPNWSAFGRSEAGTRFAPFDQIGPANVSRLKVAWQFHMGALPHRRHYMDAEEQNTPLQVGARVFVCNGVNVTFALDADTGRQLWRFDPHANSPTMPRCRGLGYHEDTPAPASLGGDCPQRILLNTVDARLIALNAATGKRCKGFGRNGQVDLMEGMGRWRPGMYQTNSAPTIAGDLVVVGGWVMDNQQTRSPSGVVRAFDIHSGKLAWAWDLAQPERTGLPPQGQTYTLDTPNMWGKASVDEKLGLIYLPMGNRTPDFWGGGRSKAVDDHSAAIVALDMKTGRERWLFRTVLHDVWDYDIGAQPILYDLPGDRGATTPVLVALTKRAQIFVLDRRTGKPVAPVMSRPVSTDGAIDGETLSPVQPYSVAMPQMGPARLTESQMWGATPLDQLWCRIEFRKLRYDGDFTPQGTRDILIWPGWLGGFNWWGGTVDEKRGYLVANDNRIGVIQRLVPRKDADRRLKAYGGDYFTGDHLGLRPQYGLPWAVEARMFMSPLGIPCNTPPWGTLSAIDLKTRKMVWQVPTGTPQDTGPFGIKTGLHLPIGMPTLGGAITTRSGLVFHAATLDYFLRAYDARSGKILWKGRLPVGSQASPMSYVSPRSGRQYVAIVAGGMRYTPDTGDSIIAYALPDVGKRVQ